MASHDRFLRLENTAKPAGAAMIAGHAQSWRGQIKPNERLTALVTTAINSPMIEVRMAGLEAHLAQYNLYKLSA